MMPFGMNNFGGYSICGKRGGLPFVDADRPISSTGKCAEGLVPCSNHTSVENTICYNNRANMRDEVCPITKFILFKSNTTAQGTNSMDFGPYN